MARSAGSVRARGEAAADGTACEPRGLAGREGANLGGPKARLHGAWGPKSLRLLFAAAVSTRRVSVDRSRTVRKRVVGRKRYAIIALFELIINFFLFIIN